MQEDTLKSAFQNGNFKELETIIIACALTLIDRHNGNWLQFQLC